LLLCVIVVTGCQCNINGDDLNQIKDGGVDVNDAGPPPPEFPLKAGDAIEFTALGGRTATCSGGGAVGNCDRAIRADYLIDSVALDADTNRWTVTADFVYQGTTDTIEASAIGPLILENGAPFSAVSIAAPSSGSADFSTSTAPTDELTPNGFPFFQYDPADPGVFEEAGLAFCARYQTLDAAAECNIQAADQKMEVFFKDEAAGAGGAKLHKVRAEFHKMGFVCGWDELLIPFQDEATTPRQQSSFADVDAPDLAAIFTTVKIERDDVTYNCSCFSQTCRAGNGADATCLSTDPDEPPGPCE